MNTKTLIVSILISLALVANGFKQGRNLAEPAEDAAACKSCVMSSTDWYCYDSTVPEPVMRCCEAGVDDDNEDCQSTTGRRCTNTNDFEQNAAMLTCPMNIGACGDSVSAGLFDGGEDTYLASGIPSDEYCFYYVMATTDSPFDGSLSYQYTLKSEDNAKVEIYSWETTGVFTYLGELEDGDTIHSEVKIAGGRLYALVYPEDDSSQASAKLYAQVLPTSEAGSSGNIVAPALSALFLVLALMQVF